MGVRFRPLPRLCSGFFPRARYFLGLGFTLKGSAALVRSRFGFFGALGGGPAVGAKVRIAAYSTLRRALPLFVAVGRFLSRYRDI